MLAFFILSFMFSKNPQKHNPKHLVKAAPIKPQEKKITPQKQKQLAPIFKPKNQDISSKNPYANFLANAGTPEAVKKQFSFLFAFIIIIILIILGFIGYIIYAKYDKNESILDNLKETPKNIKAFLLECFEKAKSKFQNTPAANAPAGLPTAV